MYKLLKKNKFNRLHFKDFIAFIQQVTSQDPQLADKKKLPGAVQNDKPKGVGTRKSYWQKVDWLWQGQFL